MTTAETPVVEVPVTEARERLADLINHALYAGDSAYLTRRGHRVAMVVPPEALAQARAEGAELAILRMVTAMHEADLQWRTGSTSRAFDPHRAWKLVRDDLMSTLERMLEASEDEADVTAADAALEEIAAGAPTTSLADLRRELGL